MTKYNVVRRTPLGDHPPIVVDDARDAYVMGMALTKEGDYPVVLVSVTQSDGFELIIPFSELAAIAYA